MRALAQLLALLVAMPVLAGADEPRAPRPPPPETQATPAASPAPRPPPPPGASDPGPHPVPGPPPAPPPGAYPPYDYGWDAGWGMGWGAAWGYGWLPAYGEPVMIAPGAPPPWPPPPSPPPPPPSSAVLRVSFGTGTMGGMHDGSNSGEIWGTSFLIDSTRLGFDMAFDAFTPTSVGGSSTTSWSGVDPYGLSSFHFTWSFLAGRSYRLRALVGGSWLSVPASTSSLPADSFGPDLGLSGQLGIVGPLGLEAHARWTPVPIMVFDGGVAAALHFGPFGLSMGYRWVEVAEDSRTGPAVGFQGPEMALGVIF